MIQCMFCKDKMTQLNTTNCYMFFIRRSVYDGEISRTKDYIGEICSLSYNCLAPTKSNYLYEILESTYTLICELLK